MPFAELPVGCGIPSPTSRRSTSLARSAENVFAGALTGLGAGGRNPATDRIKITIRMTTVGNTGGAPSVTSGPKYTPLRVILGCASFQVNAQVESAGS